MENVRSFSAYETPDLSDGAQFLSEGYIADKIVYMHDPYAVPLKFRSERPVPTERNHWLEALRIKMGSDIEHIALRAAPVTLRDEVEDFCASVVCHIVLW